MPVPQCPWEKKVPRDCSPLGGGGSVAGNVELVLVPGLTWPNSPFPSPSIGFFPPSFWSLVFSYALCFW